MENYPRQERSTHEWASPLRPLAHVGPQLAWLFLFAFALPHASAQARSHAPGPPPSSSPVTPPAHTPTNSSSSAAGSWQTYPFPDDGFRAAFPSQPKVDSQTVKTDAGSFELHDYVVDLGSTALYIGVCDYGDSMSGRDPQSVLEGAQGGAVNNVKARILTSKTITIGSYPGRTFEAENDNLHFSARLYLVDTVLYQSLVAYPLHTQYPGATRFLDSFQLITRVTK